MDLTEVNERLIAARREGQTWAQIADSLSVSISTLRRLRMKSGFVEDDRISIVGSSDVLADEVIAETLDEMLSLGFTYVAIAKKLMSLLLECNCMKWLLQT